MTLIRLAHALVHHRESFQIAWRVSGNGLPLPGNRSHNPWLGELETLGLNPNVQERNIINPRGNIEEEFLLRRSKHPPSTDEISEAQGD